MIGLSAWHWLRLWRAAHGRVYLGTPRMVDITVRLMGWRLYYAMKAHE